jgi:lipopolysaccharide export system protein LptA
LAVLVVPLSGAWAQSAPAIKQDTPIEITSDKLDVFQNENKAIFTGNVIAVQGTTNMRSTEMTVFYRDKGTAAPTPAPAPDAAPAPQGIYRIEAQGSVVFTTPTEVALGDKAIYNVDTDTIDVFGNNVTLTQGKNILKGTKLNYNMATRRSILTGGTNESATSKPKRVQGLFVPKSDKPAAKP